MKRFTAALVAVLLFAVGCTLNPVKRAETTEQKADALYGSFVVMQGQVVEYLRDPTTPQAAKDFLADADLIAKPIADDLHQTVIRFSAVKRAFVAAQAAADASDADPADKAKAAAARAALEAAAIELNEAIVRTTEGILKYIAAAQGQMNRSAQP